MHQSSFIPQFQVQYIVQTNTFEERKKKLFPIFPFGWKGNFVYLWTPNRCNATAAGPFNSPKLKTNLTG